jgi:arylsulfatase A-like enzyme
VRYREHLGRSVATAQWHYTEWDRGQGGAMLLDRVNDPHELRNLAADPAYAKERATMKALLAKLPEPAR